MTCFNESHFETKEISAEELLAKINELIRANMFYEPMEINNDVL